MTLPDGKLSHALVASFFPGNRITYTTLAMIVGLITGRGALTQSDSRSTEEHPKAPQDGTQRQ